MVLLLAVDDDSSASMAQAVSFLTGLLTRPRRTGAVEGPGQELLEDIVGLLALVAATCQAAIQMTMPVLRRCLTPSAPPSSPWPDAGVGRQI